MWMDLFWSVFHIFSLKFSALTGCKKLNLLSTPILPAQKKREFSGKLFAASQCAEFQTENCWNGKFDVGFGQFFCQSISLIFIVLGIYNFAWELPRNVNPAACIKTLELEFPVFVLYFFVHNSRNKPKSPLFQPSGAPHPYDSYFPSKCLQFD